MINTEELVTSVADDRIITVLVGEGEDQQKFMLQDTLIRRTSRVFSASLNHEHLGDEAKGTLRFPEDDVPAWKVLVFWMFGRTLPEDDLNADASGNQQLLLIDCWVLGDKYDIAEFQDIVMLELLAALDEKYMGPVAANRAAGGSPTGSKLRKMAAREVALGYRKGKFKIEDFNAALAVVGFAAEVVTEIYAQENGGTYGRCGHKDGKHRSDAWKKFMVATQPRKHWVFNTQADAPEE